MNELRSSTRRIVSNVWYGVTLGADMHPEPTGGAVSAIRAALSLARASGSDGIVVTTEGTSTPIGIATLAAVCAVRGARQLVILEFLPGIKAGPRGRLIRFLYRRLLHRSAASIQVMTNGERDLYADEYNVDPEILVHVPFFHYNDAAPRKSTSASERAGVFASGRHSCDWVSLIEAARGRSWGLTIACAADEHDRVASAAAGTDIRVVSEIPIEQHDELLAASDVYVLPLLDRPLSAGHVRIMSAATFETPVVVTDVRGVDGYTHIAADVVPPGDAMRLRTAVENLLNDPELRAVASARALELSMTSTRSKYLEEVGELVHKV